MDIGIYRQLTMRINNCRQLNNPKDEEKWIVIRYIWCIKNNCSFFKGIKRHRIRSSTKFRKRENYIRHVERQKQLNMESERDAAMLVEKMGYCPKTGEERIPGNAAKLPRFTT